MVVKQIEGEFQTHNERMMAYLNQYRNLFQNIPSWTITNVGREENQWADSLSKLASSVALPTEEPIYVEDRQTPSIDEGSTVCETYHSDDWRTPFLQFILDDKLPENKSEACSIAYKTKNYCVIDNKLFR